MLDAMRLLGESPSLIIETGMSAWGTNSSLLFDDYVCRYGGTFYTVDIRLRPLMELRSAVSHQTRLSCNDSVRFLQKWVRSNPGRRANLVYLDSFDLNPRLPYESALHGIREFLAIRPALGKGSLLLVDDTPINPEACPPEWRQEAESFLKEEGVMPGKGMLIVPYLDSSHSVTKLRHGYQVLYRFDR
jgi:cephalosporin hydroxylase